MNTVTKDRIVKIIFFGDSSISGQGIAPENIWVSLMGNYFYKQYYNASCDVLCLNKGVSGDNTRNGLERFQNDVQKESPDILVIQFGIIDSMRWLSNKGLPCVSEEAFTCNIKEMILRARIFGTKNIILMCTHCTHRDNATVNGLTQNQNLDRYNDIIRKTARHENVLLIDLWKVIDKSKVNKCVFSMPDGNHLTLEGHKMYYKAIVPVIRKIVSKIIV